MIKLLPQERLICKYHPHPLFLVGWMIAFSLFFVLLGFVPALHPRLLDRSSWDTILTACYLFCILTACLDWYCTRFYLTDIRVITTKGFVGRTVIAIPLLRIQDISHQYGTMGRIFEYGDLTIESASAQGQVVFKRIPHPMLVQQKIHIQIIALKTLQQLEKVIQPL